MVSDKSCRDSDIRIRLFLVDPSTLFLICIAVFTILYGSYRSVDALSGFSSTVEELGEHLFSIFTIFVWLLNTNNHKLVIFLLIFLQNKTP
jgi:hypothetical protein